MGQSFRRRYRDTANRSSKSVQNSFPRLRPGEIILVPWRWAITTATASPIWPSPTGPAAPYRFSWETGLLTSVFSLVIGMERIFHLDEMEDAGFARLCGGRRCPSRHTVGGWRRHLPWYEVDAFCRRTCPWHLLHNEDALVSFDEHTIPRWTKKFHIGKGYSTTRNKYMRCEKLFTGYDLGSGRFLSVRGTPGNVNLQDLAVPLVQQVLRQGRPRSLHALFDAGAGKSDAGVRALWDLAEQHPNLDVTLRACRYPHRMRAWKQLPSGLFVSVEDPGVCVDAPPKEVRLAA